MKKSFNIIFMGTPDFAVPCLEKLNSEGHHILCTVTQPDRRKGRGKKISFSPVKQKSLELDIEVFQPERIKHKSAIEHLKSLNPDLLVTCAYGQILSAKLLEIPKYGCINVHASLLPEYRGAAPIQRCILNGDKKTGITTMMTDVGMDTGDILIRKEMELPIYMTAGQLHDKLSEMGADLIIETLNKLADGTLAREKQNDNEATYAPRIEKTESIIDWHGDSFDIHNKVRAFDPWPGCFTQYNKKRMRIIKSSFSEKQKGVQPGTLIKADKQSIDVACQRGVLSIMELQFENGKRMDAKSCWHNFNIGDTFGKG